MRARQKLSTPDATPYALIPRAGASWVTTAQPYERVAGDRKRRLAAMPPDMPPDCVSSAFVMLTQRPG
jgi:hypothetical protein